MNQGTPLQGSNNNNNNHLLLKIANDTTTEATNTTLLATDEFLDEFLLNNVGERSEVEQKQCKDNALIEEDRISSVIDSDKDNLSEAFPTPDYANPYERCIELLESNFTCKTRSPYIRLNQQLLTNDKNDGTDNQRATASTTTLTTLKNPASSEQINFNSSINNNINSMSVITLTEFLQKSVIIPLQTHLNLVNSEVMSLFLEDLEVFDHFRSLRNYFFLMDGEFGSIICDGIIGKLEYGTKPATLLNYQTLHSILDTAIGSSLTGKFLLLLSFSFFLFIYEIILNIR